MSKWQERPTEIKNWPVDMDYVLCIDENGDSNVLKNIQRKISNNEKIDVSEKFFTLTGCIINKESYMILLKKFHDLKYKYWTKGEAEYISKGESKIKKVCFHTREINNRLGPFHFLEDNFKPFIEDLSNIIKDIDFIVVSMSINAEDYLKRELTEDMYNKCFNYILEQYYDNIPKNKQGIIIFEGRGKNEDKNLLNYIKQTFYTDGTEYVSTQKLTEKIKGVYFNPKWHSDTNDAYVGLELTDLISYPIYKYVKYNKKDINFSTIESKIYGFPELLEKGIKIFP